MRDFVLKGFHVRQQVKLPLVLGAQHPLSPSVQQLPGGGCLRQDLFGDTVLHLGVQEHQSYRTEQLPVLFQPASVGSHLRTQLQFE